VNAKAALTTAASRFLLFLPEEEMSSIEVGEPSSFPAYTIYADIARLSQRICFQIEEAHWFYEDFIREINPSVPNLHLRQFIHQLLNHVPRSLISHIPLWKTETAFTEFMSYKTRVPVRGCIMLNEKMNKCILVKGWKSGASWSFPRGKIDQNEDDRDCAIRETLEETGFDLTGMVGVNDKIDINIRGQDMKLYIAPGVPEDFEFAPRTRKEISVRSGEFS
jgi:mRNA-decapping enzyme subunit 2